jgi:hypothetical protein
MHECTVYDDLTVEALRRGEKRLSIVVASYEPPSAGGSAIVVWFVDERGMRTELTRFGVHPAHGLRAGAEPQRFLVSLEGHPRLLHKGAPVCIDVGFDASAAAVRGGVADIRVEVVDLPGAKR